MNEPIKFWAVWRETGGAAPSKRHATKQEALTEAQRLAQQSSERYYVLEAIGSVAPMTSIVNYTEFSNNYSPTLVANRKPNTF